MNIPSWKHRTWIFVVMGLFLGSVFTAGHAIHTSYELAQLGERERVARAQIDRLEERLAQASALSTVLSYAESNGFVSAAPIASLKVTTPVAQNTLGW